MSFPRVAVECRIFWGTARSAAAAWESDFRLPLKRWWPFCRIVVFLQADDRTARRGFSRGWLDLGSRTKSFVSFFSNLNLPWPADCVGRADRLTSWKRVRQFSFEASSKRWHSSSHSSADDCDGDLHDDHHHDRRHSSSHSSAIPTRKQRRKIRQQLSRRILSMDILPQTDTCVSFMRRRYCYMHNAHVQGYLAPDPTYLLWDPALAPQSSHSR